MRNKDGSRGLRYAYDPQADDKAKIKAMCRVALYRPAGLKAPHAGPVSLELIFCIKPPQSTTKCKKSAMLWGIIKPTCKPDLDNLEKTYKDCLTGVAYLDDAQVIALKSRKRYSIKVGVEIILTTLEPMQLSENASKILQIMPPTDVMAMAEMSVQLMRRSKGVIEGTEPFEQEVLEDIARMISAIADQHSKELGKISKEFPGFYLRGKNG